MSVQGLSGIGQQELIKLYQNTKHDDTNLEKVLTDLKIDPVNKRDILMAAEAKNCILNREFLVKTFVVDETESEADYAEDIATILAAYNLDVAEAGGSTVEPGSEFFRAATAGNAQGTRETENTNIDLQIDDFCNKYTDADLERLGNLGFSRDTVRNNFERWVRAAIGNPPDKDKLAVLDYNFNFFLSDEATAKMVSSLMHMANYDTGDKSDIHLAERLTEKITSKRLDPTTMTEIIKKEFLVDLLSASWRHETIGEDFREALSLAINSKNSPMFGLANYIYGLINDGTIDVDMGQKILKAKSGKASPEEREQIYRELEAKYGKEMADRIMDDIQKELQRQYDNLSEEERAEHADKWEAIHDTAKQDQEIFKKLGWTKSLQSAENLVASISPMLAARASAPGLNPTTPTSPTAINPGVLSSTVPPPLLELAHRQYRLAA